MPSSPATRTIAVSVSDADKLTEMQYRLKQRSLRDTFALFMQHADDLATFIENKTPKKK